MGCAATSYVTLTAPSGMPGIYHRVEKGQTLWRISKTYQVDLDEIVRINRILDASRIEAGQLIFIPKQDKQRYASSVSSAEDFIWPIRGKVISSFGQTFNSMVNKGINIQPYRSDDVVATHSGKVIFYADDFKNFGKTIIIDHGDGFSSVYASNLEVFVKPGDAVNRGTPIAKISAKEPGKFTYLHFEIRKSHIPKNPYFYLP